MWNFDVRKGENARRVHPYLSIRTELLQTQVRG
jgi:hypothetical protein